MAQRIDRRLELIAVGQRELGRPHPQRLLRPALEPKVSGAVREVRNLIEDHAAFLIDGIETRLLKGMRPGFRPPTGHRERRAEERAVRGLPAHRERPSDVGVEHAQGPGILQGRRHVLAYEHEVGAEGPCHRQEIHHVIAEMLRDEKNLRLVRQSR